MVKVYAVTYRGVDHFTAITKIFDNKDKARKLYNKIKDELLAYYFKHKNEGVSVEIEGKTKNTLVLYCECEDICYEGQSYFVKMKTKEMK